MKSAWEEVTLGDILTLKRGYDLPAMSRKPGSVPVVSSSGVTGSHSEGKVPSPGVVTGRYGTLGEVFYLEEPFWPLNTTLYVRDFKGNHPRWISYLLRTMGFGQQSGAAAVPGINRNALHALPTRRPPLETQRQIAAVLAAYDESVENNQRRIAVLEDMVQAIYRQWCVNHEPPDALLGKGIWTDMRFGEIADEVRQGADPRTLESYTPYVGLEHIPRQSIVLAEWGDASDVASRKWRFRKGDILFGKLRPYFHKVIRAPMEGVTSTDAIVMRPRENVEEFALLIAASLEFVEHATATAGGTDRPRANWSDLANFTVPLPPRPALREFKELSIPPIDLMSNLAMQNRNLRATRDLLLPKLISGNIDVSDLDVDTSWLAS